jgi:transcriptional regulator with XRE-family HTH domain
VSKSGATRLERILARRLREVCEVKHVPLSHLADRAGVARSHVFALLKCERSASLGMVELLAETLGVDPLELLRGEPARLPKRKRS